MKRRNRVDVPALVTGLALIGIALLGGAVVLGRGLASPMSVWFAGILIISGVVGLAVSLGQRTRDGE